MEAKTLNELLALTLEVARLELAGADPRDKRGCALVVTKLEEAALWKCEAQAREHLGEDALLNWLLGE